MGGVNTHPWWIPQVFVIYVVVCDWWATNDLFSLLECSVLVLGGVAGSLVGGSGVGGHGDV